MKLPCFTCFSSFAGAKLANRHGLFRRHTSLWVVNARKLLNWIFLVHYIHYEKSDYVVRCTGCTSNLPSILLRKNSPVVLTSSGGILGDPVVRYFVVSISVLSVDLRLSLAVFLNSPTGRTIKINPSSSC